MQSIVSKKQIIIKKYFNMKTIFGFIWTVSRFVIVFGICFIILYPFIVKIMHSIMSPEDLLDPTVRYISKSPSIYFFKKAIDSIDFWPSFRTTLFLSLSMSIIQMLVSTFVGYGFSRFKYKGSNIVFVLTIFTLLVPPQLILTPLFFQFRYFNLFGLSFNLIDTFFPFFILSLTGLGIKNGLYIYMMRQFYRGMPIELEEAAYIDGVGAFKTFIRVIIPNSIPMMLTVFLFSLSWQWTDTIFSNVFFSNMMTLSKIILKNIVMLYNDPIIVLTTRNTASLIVIFPLVLLYVFAQKMFIEGIERSGIVG